MNDRFLRALRREPVDCTPIWIMRQAGRYLPEYRQARERAGNFLTLCKTPELACEVTLQPLERFALDAAILFSDILTIPDAMGLGLSIEEGVGPRFEHRVTTADDVARLIEPDPNVDLHYVMDAVRLVKQRLVERVPLIGFAGSPWTLATYMIEGRSGHDFKESKRMLFAEPATLHALLDKLTRACVAYLRAQIDAGADAVMIFDTWGGVLTPAAYREFSLNYMQRILAGLQPSVPSIVFSKGGGQWLETIADSGCAAVGLDWTTDIGDARRRIGDRVALQGNLDPAVMLTDAVCIRAEARRVLDAFGNGGGHIFNLGHGITPDVDPDLVGILVDAVHELSAA
jgi:uroporphyrinogen decarboxylase